MRRVQCSSIEHSAVQSYWTQCSAVLLSTVQCSTSHWGWVSCYPCLTERHRGGQINEQCTVCWQPGNYEHIIERRTDPPKLQCCVANCPQDFCKVWPGKIYPLWDTRWPSPNCRTLEGPATRGFSIFVRPYVRRYVSNSFSLLLLGQYTSDLQYFYRFRTPYKWLLGGLIRGAPDPPNPPYGGAKIYFGGFY